MEQQNAETAKPGRLKISDKPPAESHREYLDMDTDEEEFGHQETPEPQDEAPLEPDKPVFTPAELDKLVDYTKELTVLPNLSDSDWTTDNYAIIREYFCEPSRLVLTIFYSNSRLCALLGFPNHSTEGLTYFLRQPWQVYTPKNFMDTVTFGSMGERVERTVLGFVAGLYAPIAFASGGWPEIMRDDIFSNLNDFITRAIDVTYKPMGILVLYIPWEGIIAGAQNEEKTKTLELSGERIKRLEEQALLINRLEKVAKTWIRQIREALLVAPLASDELHCVSREFEFWQSRYENLASISKQLESEQVKAIIKQLRRIKSTSINDLKVLVMRVKEALEQAKSNLSYLDIVLENCKGLAEPKLVDDCMPKILHVVRFVWTESTYYNELKNIERLLCSISVHVVKMCTGNVDLQLIFDDPKACSESLKTCLSCCDSYSKIYDSIIESCLSSNDAWKVNKDTAFNCINAFKQRCQDVAEICDTILIYGSLNKINLGGTKGNQHEMQYANVKEYFSQIMNEMRICCDYALDIKKTKWFEDISNFQCDVTELENTIKNLLNDLFRDVENVEMGIETLYTLSKFKERQGFQDILHDKWAQVWEIFYEEIKLCSLEDAEQGVALDQVKLLQSENVLIPAIYKNYLTRLRKMLINASDWLGDCDIQFEIPSKYFNTKDKS